MMKPINIVLAVLAGVLAAGGCEKESSDGIRPVRTGRIVPGEKLTEEILDGCALKERWRMTIEGRPRVKRAWLLKNDLVLSVVSMYQGQSRFELIALDRKTGRLNWQAFLPAAPVTAPVENDTNVYLFVVGRFMGFEKTTGGREIINQTQDFVPFGDPALDNQFVYIMGNDNKLYAVNLTDPGKTDNIAWWKYDVQSTVNGAPVVRGAAVFFADTTGTVSALTPTPVRPNLHWEFKADAPIQGGLALGEDRLVVGSSDGKLYALNLGKAVDRRRQQVWLLPYQAGSDIETTPVVAGKLVFVQARDTGYHAVSLADGTFVWKIDGTRTFVSQSKGGLTHLADTDGNIIAYDTASGKKRWTLPTGEFKFRPACIDSGDIFLVGARAFVRVLTSK